MTYPDAPYHADVASGPPQGRAHWVTAADGVRVRVAVWPEGTRGTVMIVPGRTEYTEKYSDAAAQLHARGFASVAIDVRGQGLSPRPAHDRLVGHVNDFKDFQIDVDAALAMCTDMDLPRPWYILGHSMGGLIALRTLVRCPTAFRRAAFSAPMWGLPLPPHRRFMGWTISSAAAAIGLGERSARQSGNAADPAAAPFEDNLLTRDARMFAWMKRQITTYPDLALGGPSLGWVWAALREMHACARLAAPGVPALTFLGTDEDIVSADSIHVRMASWPNGELQMVEGARHEVLMENAELRGQIYDSIAAHFDGRFPTPAP
ncbi:lysophospholipase [Jannaschia faecimaris]|uniref:Lysophospholipase n=1 Tax=Jannaschia faecimaris TaxID=1244108 RepID=A0A1H3QEH9_9RHOB|nr:alpha/beta hydrolase [Jannaschia faecimaris]SDZ11425.1 lysophospholipase [Jannaschia faecimaris]